MKILNFIRAHKKKVVATVVFIGVVVFLCTYYWSGADISTVVARKKNLREEVSVTGRVLSQKKADLAFEQGGKIARVAIRVGDRVTAGQSLTWLNNADSVAQVEEAQATVKIQQAKLDELMAGARPENIDVQDFELQKAEQELNNIYTNVMTHVRESFNTADGAVRTKTASMFTGSEKGSYQLTFTACHSAQEELVRMLRRSSEARLNTWQKEIDVFSMSSSYTLLSEGLAQAQSHLTYFQNFLQEISRVLTGGCAGSNNDLSTHRTNISSARSAIDNAIADLVAIQQSLLVQEKNIDIQKSRLSLELAGTRPEHISVQKAYVEQAEAQLKNAWAEREKTIIRSPFSGVVTKVDVIEGEIASSNEPIVTIITDDTFILEAHVPEVDISKIMRGHLARVILDAYTDDDIFSARVVSIDPAETIIEGIATYKITLMFTNNDERVRSGMTATIDIITDFHSNSVTVPARAISSQEGKHYIRVLKDDGTIHEIEIKTGLKSLSHDVEIISGVREGDLIVISK